MAKLTTWADPFRAIVISECRASTGPNGEWTDGNKVCGPFTICADVRGWKVLGKINGCDWYVTKAIDDPHARHGFRTWRDALAACRRFKPGAVVMLRTSDRRERQVS